MNEEAQPLPADALRDTEAGVVGIGTMGASIVACLLAAGHRVRAVEPVEAAIPAALERTRAHLDSIEARYRPQGADEILRRLTISPNYADLSECAVVVETVLEKLEIKHEVIRRIEDEVDASALIGTNTSALRVTQLQQAARQPGRVLGLHWGTPPMLPFLEIIRGDATSDEAMARVAAYAQLWGKTPTLVQKDIHGFVANRLGYAMFREAWSLYAKGIASPADIDRAARYTLGVWAAFEGPLAPLEPGFELALETMRDLFPDLCNDQQPPAFLEEMARTGQRHFYDAAAEFNADAERRHLEGIARRAAEELARLDAMEQGQTAAGTA